MNHAAGLLGVSGISSDYRQVESAARQGNERARLALEIYADRVSAAVGSLAVTLGGVDALVFTAGVGQNSASLRAAACQGLECIGVRLDPSRNGDCRPDADVATDESPARILVIRTREELLIAREAQKSARQLTLLNAELSVEMVCSGKWGSLVCVSPRATSAGSPSGRLAADHAAGHVHLSVLPA